MLSMRLKIENEDKFKEVEENIAINFGHFGAQKLVQSPTRFNDHASVTVSVNVPAGCI